MMVESGAPPAEESPRPTTLRRGVSFVTAESRPSDVADASADPDESDESVKRPAPKARPISDYDDL